MTKREELKQLSEFACRQVCSVHGYLTASESDRIARLEYEIGEEWNAVDQKWEPVDEYDMETYRRMFG